MPKQPTLFESQSPVVPGGPQPGSPVEEEEKPSQVLFRPDAVATAPGVVVSVKNSFSLDSPIASTARRMELAGAAVDPSWILTPENQNALMHDVPERLKRDMLDAMTDATSQESAELIKGQFLKEVEREQSLADGGMGGMAVRFLTNVLDPVNIVLAFGTGGLSHITKAGALRGALKVGALTAAENAAIETAIVAGSHTRGVDDVIYSALGGFALGSGVGAFLGRSNAFADATNIARDRQVRGSLGDALDSAGMDSVGAARAVNVTEPLMEDQVARMFDISTDPDVPKSAFGAVRYDAVGTLGQDADPFARDAARAFAEEGVGLEGHGTVRFGASERAAQTHRTLMTDFRLTTNAALQEWLQESGTGWTGSVNLAKRDEFFSEVGRAVREGAHESAAVMKAAGQTQKTFSQYLQALKKAKVAGFEDIPTNKNYLPRVFNHAGIREFTARYGSKALGDLVAKSLRAATPGLDKVASQRLAKAYATKIRRMANGMDSGLAHGLRTDDVDMLREILRESDLDEAAIEATIMSTKKATEKSSKVTRAKGRADLDETEELQVKNMQTGEVDTVSMAAILENNVEKVMFGYSRSMSGWIGMARQAGIKSPAELKKFLDVIRSRGEELGQEKAVIDAKVKRFQFLADGITGVPLESDPASLFARASRAARDFNFLRVGGAFGMAQLAEIGNNLGTVGLRNMISLIPELRGMIKRGVDGKLTSELAADLEDMLAPGTDRLINQASTRWEEHGFGSARTSIGKAVDDAMQVAKRATADLGGLNAATIVFQRAAASGIAQKLAGFAHGAKLSKAQARRLAGMGIREDMWVKIKGQLKKHGSTRDSWVPGRKKLISINPGDWKDEDALDTFTMAIHREARRVVQENDIGASTPWLHSTTGKLLTQFRSFMLTSYSKATLHNIHHHDFQAFAVLAHSMFFGGLAYTAQQSINISDKRERERRLAPEEIAKAAFQRTGVSSMVPMMVDSAATHLFRMDPVFAYGRSSGLATGALSGNSTVDLLDKLSGVAGLPAVLARPDTEFSKRDYRSLTGLIPVLGGMTGMRRVLDALGPQ